MQLKKLTQPKSIAVVGVSDKHGFGKSAAEGTLNSKIRDHVYFVHPRRTEFEGKKCYPTITDLPEVVDCVVLCTPAKTIAGLLREAGEKGIGAAIVYASGFSEEGTLEGRQLEQELKEIAHQYDIAVLGPNGMGFINNVDKINMWGCHTYWDLDDPAHGIAIIAQSGFVSAQILNTDFFTISYAVSSGNGNICTLEDFLSLMIDDEEVSVIALYLEGVRNPKSFLASLERAAKIHKPIVILKSGKSERGAAAAASHTGSMAGSSKAFDSIFEKYGVIVAESFEEFMCLSQALCVLRGNFPKHNSYGVISFSGGESTVSADVAEAMGANLAELSDETKKNIQKFIPAFATAKNPLDATTALFRDEPRTIGLLKAFNDDPAVAGITVGANIERKKDETNYELCLAMAKAVREGIVTKPVFAIPSLEDYRHRASRRVLEDAGIPMMSSMETAFRCLRKIAEFGEYHYTLKSFADCVPKNHSSDETAYALSEFDSKNELIQYGIPVPAQAVVRSKEELQTALSGMKYPVVLKINSNEILHKTEAGGVKLNIQNITEAAAAYEEILSNVKKKLPNAATDGILVQEMVPSGVEMIIGITNDKQFGPMLLVGLGGIYVEIFKDVSLYPIPVNRQEAGTMLEKLRAYPLLAGYRGSSLCDLEALKNLMVKISDYAAEHKDEIKEMDLNPVFVYPKGQGVCAVDALIVKYQKEKEKNDD